MKPTEKIKKIKKERRLSLWLLGWLLVLGVIVVTVFGSSGLASLVSRSFHIELTFTAIGWIVLFAIAIGAAGAAAVSAFYVKPVKMLESAMNEVAGGNFGIQLNDERKLREIRSLYSDFNHMARGLAATEILQSDFVANVSHEFKTPVAAIEGYAQLLQDETLTPEERRQYTEKLLAAAQRLSGLVGDVLLLSKVESGSPVGQAEPFRADEEIRQAIIALEQAWEEKEIEMDVSLAPLTCVGNAGLLYHVWSNVLGNAVKFTPPGGRVTVRLRAVGGQAEFRVEDNGPGLSEKDLACAFNKFYQGDASRAVQGNGLGLALVKRIAELNGGYVTCENLPGGGCAFTVFIKLNEN